MNAESLRRVTCRIGCLPAGFLFGLFFFTLSVLADPFGGSGGVRNESDVPVNVKVTMENGAYQWVSLYPGTSIDLYENAASISLHGHPSYPMRPSTKIQVVVILPDGSRKTLTVVEDSLVLKSKKETLKSSSGLDA